MDKYIICVPWHKKEVGEAFLNAWNLTSIPDWLLFEQDKDSIGCANMKNKMIQKAYDAGAEYIGVLDSDCHPVHITKEAPFWKMSLRGWIDLHIQALNDQPVEMFEAITTPQSRGTPYYNRSITMPVAASIGFWEGIPDWDAPSQLVRGNEKMTFNRKTIYNKYFAFCGMNFAFKREWFEYAKLIDIERMDDIWMGFIWQKKANEKGFCFNLAGPLVKHTRQTNVWRNLKIESEYLLKNETLWQDIYNSPEGLSYDELKNILDKTILQ